jgi:putative endonuclease
MFYVYLLKSLRNGRFYIGQTQNVEARLARHNNGRNSATEPSRPWMLVKVEEYLTRKEARWREHTLKSNTNERKKFYGV